MRIERLREFIASYRPSGVVAEGKLDDDPSGVLEFFSFPIRGTICQ